MNDRYDTFDLLISMNGYKHDGITEDMINDNLDEINRLQEEIGIPCTSERYNLILMDDSEHSQLEVIATLVDLDLGEMAYHIMKKAEADGSAVIKESTYSELREMQKILDQENYKTVIRTSLNN